MSGRYESRLFELRATGIIEARVTCDLDDRVLTVCSPPFSRADGRYGWMRYSLNIDERRIANYVVDRMSSCSEERVFHLSSAEASDLARMLDQESLSEADGMDDAKMTGLYGGWGWRDWWSMRFVAYGPDGRVVSRTEPLSMCSLGGKDSPCFERIESYLCERYDIWSFSSWQGRSDELFESTWVLDFYKDKHPKRMRLRRHLHG